MVRWSPVYAVRQNARITRNFNFSVSGKISQKTSPAMIEPLGAARTAATPMKTQVHDKACALG